MRLDRNTSACKAGAGAQHRLPKITQLVPPLPSKGLRGGLIISQHMVFPVLRDVCFSPPPPLYKSLLSTSSAPFLLHRVLLPCLQKYNSQDTFGTRSRVTFLHFERCSQPILPVGLMEGRSGCTLSSVPREPPAPRSFSKSFFVQRIRYHFFHYSQLSLLSRLCCCSCNTTELYVEPS